MDLIERGIFLAQALMFAYTVFVLIRFPRRYHLVRRECQALEDSWRSFERVQRRLIANLSSGLRTLKAITSVAPFLGLAGTSYGILASLFVGFALLRSIALHLLSVNTVATLITAATGILVAIPAILVHNFLCSRIDRFKCELSRTVTARMARHEDEGPRQFRLAQTLPLKKAFSSLPPFAVIAAPALTSVVAIFLAFEPYGTTTGLGIRLLPTGALDRNRLSHKPVIVAIVMGANGSPVICVNSRETQPNNLEEVTRFDLKLSAEPRVYVEAESTVAWADVAHVIDVMEGLNAEVVLLTATPIPVLDTHRGRLGL